jgi:hypothetical protein
MASNSISEGMQYKNSQTLGGSGRFIWRVWRNGVLMKTEAIVFEDNVQQSVCNYHTFTHKDERYLIVEQRKDATTNITNKIEEIVASITKRERIDASLYKIFEYYPASTLGRENIVFEIARVDIRDGGPVWSRPCPADYVIIKRHVVLG